MTRKIARDRRKPATLAGMTAVSSQTGSQQRPPSQRRRRWYLEAAVVIWIAVQVLLPLRCFMVDPLAKPPRFCWNMYSYRSSCTGGYLAIRGDGRRSAINPFTLFPRQSGAFVTFHREHLPAFHSWLCSGLRSTDAAVRLEGEIRCSSAGGEPTFLARRGVDLCTADNFGVLGP
jgi:hypothetical protein